MTEKIKILFCGDVEGKFDTLFKRVDTINKKSGPFDLLMCVGNFFGINNKEFDPYKIGDKKVPIPTYILGPNKEDQLDQYPKDDSEYELCTDVYYLGKRGIYNDSKGLKIAYISGTASSEKEEPWTYSEKDVSDLCDAALRGNPSFRGVDILLTSQWPAGIIADNKINLTVNLRSDVPSYLCMKLKPRYLISGLEGVYYERPPFRCPTLGDNDPSFETVTRFIGLARVGNPNKDKWLYALNVTPLDKMKISDLLQKTTDETVCPFNFYDLESRIFKNIKRKSTGTKQYFYDMNAPMEYDKHKQKAKRPRMEFDQGKCWFCLSSPSVEKHLVIHVGTYCYLTLAKGGLVKEHFLICPVEHCQNSLVCTEAVREEMQRFKEAVRKLYERNLSVPVFFERNFKTSHMQLQCVPVPNEVADQIKDTFINMSTRMEIKLTELESHDKLGQVMRPNTPFFMVELPDGTVLYTKVKDSMNFSLNFGREVLAAAPLLDLPYREDYHGCILGKIEEEKVVEKVRKDLERYKISI